MAVTTVWTNPTSAGMDINNNSPWTETVVDSYASDIYRLGGSDGNAKTGKYQIGSATTYSNANNTAGLTVNQGGADDECLTLKSSDVAHGMTAQTETETYGILRKASGASGGLRVTGLSAGTLALQLDAGHTTDDTTKTVASVGAFRLTGYLKSGTTFAPLAANANIAVITNEGATRFILDGDGDSHQDVGTAWTNFDGYDDAGLLNTLAHEVARPGDGIRAGFRSWLTYNRAALEAAELVTFNDDGHHFVNMSRLTMLLVGAARQAADRVRALEERVERLARLLEAQSVALGRPRTGNGTGRAVD